MPQGQKSSVSFQKVVFLHLVPEGDLAWIVPVCELCKELEVTNSFYIMILQYYKIIKILFTY